MAILCMLVKMQSLGRARRHILPHFKKKMKCKWIGEFSVSLGVKKAACFKVCCDNQSAVEVLKKIAPNMRL
jgi:hypothetical protein